MRIGSAKKKSAGGHCIVANVSFFSAHLLSTPVSQLINFVNFAAVASVHAADINYIYDELGRLRAVIDPNSDTSRL